LYCGFYVDFFLAMIRSHNNKGGVRMISSLNISAEQIRDYLALGWLTHDGMWVYHVWKEFGIEKANELNRAAIRAMANMEMKRTGKILGIENYRTDTFEGLARYFSLALELVLPSSVFRKFRIQVPGHNVIRWEWDDGECFAYKGMSMIGCLDGYRCGVLYRIDCWLNEMNIEHRIEPMPEKCIMHEKGWCRGDIIFNFTT
jgi:hypothetical protein